MKKLLLFLSVAFATFAYGQSSAFYFNSSPTSWVGQGTAYITGGSWTFHGSTYSYTPTSSSPAIQLVAVSLTQSGTDAYWEVDFDATPGTLFEIGKTYQATRQGFETLPNAGLDFHGNGRGDSRLTGSFTVWDFTTGADGSLKSFAADFTQYDETDPTKWNYGSIRYQSLVPVYTSPIPEPWQYAAALGAIILGCVYGRRYLPFLSCS